jgi:hypothetical protein
MPVLKHIQVNRQITAPVYQRTCDLKDLTVGDDIADAVTAYQPGTIFAISGVVHRTMASNLSVRINVNGTPVATCVLSHSVAIDTAQIFTTFSGSPALNLDDVFTWDITASDGSQDPTGVASVTVKWQ